MSGKTVKVTNRDLVSRIAGIVGGVPFGNITRPWHANGKAIYDGDDYGSLVAEFEDVDGYEVARETAATVNAFREIRKLFDEMARRPSRADMWLRKSSTILDADISGLDRGGIWTFLWRMRHAGAGPRAIQSVKERWEKLTGRRYYA